MKLTLFSFFIFFCASLFSQKSVELFYENTSLEEILKHLENSYEIKFSFNTDNVRNEKITIKGTNSLKDILKNIQSQTSLVFEKINERYYVIRNKQKKGKTTVCGYLLDNITEKPLAEAFVLNISTNKRVISDKEGFFRMYLSNPNDTLNIRFLGYKERQFVAQEIEGENCSKIFLSQDNFQLGEVIITEYVTAGISKNIGNSAINIDPQKLGILPRLVEPDVLQTLQFLPGIQSPTETASGLHIRGGTPDHNLILWDGIRMYNTGHFFDILSVFNPYITENVKLQRSNTEARYGNRISGVIDITSKTEIPEDIRMGLGFNLTNTDIFVEIPFSENFGIIASGRRSYNDFLETVTFKNYSERAFQTIRFFRDEEFINQQMIDNNNAFSFSDYTIKAISKISETDRITFSNIFTNNNLDYDFNILNIRGFYDQNQEDNLKFVNQGSSLNWDKKWSPNFSHTLKTYFSNYDFDYSGRREILISDGTLFFENDIIEKNEIRDVGASLHTDWKMSPKHNTLFGYEFSTNEVLYRADYSAEDFEFEESGSNITHSLYAEHRLSFNKKTRLNLGIRSNYFSVTDQVFWEPRLSFELDLLKGIKTTLSAERKNQVISQVSNYLPSDFNIDNQVWLLADSEFTSVLKSDQFTTGFVFNKNSWYLDLEAYYKKITGLTSFANGFNGVLDFYQGESDVFGVDFLIKKQIKNYRTWLGYSFTDQNFSFDEVNDGNTFPGNFDITHYLYWVHSYTLNNFEFSLGWNIRTGRPYTQATGLTETDEFILIDYADANSSRLDTYHRLDFSASYKFGLTKDNASTGRLSLSLFNLYDRKNILNRIYTVAFTDDEDNPYLLQESDTFSAGLTPNVSFRIVF